MSLAFTPTRGALAVNLTKPFAGAGGTEPYTYSVIAGGVGGTIDTDGTYTSPNLTGADFIQVRDALGATATASILVGTPLELLCDIIETELGLNPGRVVLWDQKVDTPNDQNLWIAVSVLDAKPFGNSNKFDADLGQIQSVNIRLNVGVDIMSRSTEALLRKEEIFFAVNSLYSEQQQELNSFRIFPITNSFVNLSQIDGAAIPYRFNLTIGMQYFATKTKAAPYLDDFTDVTPITEP